MQPTQLFHSGAARQYSPESASSSVNITYPLLLPASHLVSSRSPAMSSGTDPADLHAATQQRVGYKTSDLRWGDEGLAIVLDRSGQQLLVVPIQFLRQGIVNNFAYILRCIHWAYVVSGGHIRNEQGIALNALDAVTPGRFVYWNDGK